MVNIDRPSQLQIGKALGLSPASISKYRARGMPTGSVDAAAAWHREHVKATAHRVPRMPATAQRHGEQSCDAAARAFALLDLADKVLASGNEIAAMIPELRQALRAVPGADRASILVPFEVFDVLTANVLAALQDDEPGDNQATPPMSDAAAEAAAMGDFWYRCAAGEIRPA